MKKKIIALLAIFMLICTNYAFAFTETTGCTLKYERVIGEATEKKLKSIATVKDENTRIDARYTAKTTSSSQNYTNRDYTSDSSCAKINIAQSESACDFKTTNKCYIQEESEDGYIDRYLAIKLSNATSTITFSDNELYIIYKNGVSYNGEIYDVKLQVNSIRAKLSGDNEIRFHVGRYRLNGNDKEPIGFLPGVGAEGDRDAVEVDVSYIVQDSTGNQIPVNGVFIISDIDLEQGVALEDVDVTRQRVYMDKDTQTNQLSDTLDYSTKTEGNKTTSYIYTTESDNIYGNHIHSYVTMTDKSKIDMTFTFGVQNAYSTVGYDTTFENYYKIETNAINGTIDENNYNVRPSDNKTINYRPIDDTYYLKRITVNNENMTLVDAIKNSFSFMNINSDNTIEVEYAKKVTVKFNSKGGTSVPTQTLTPGSTAFEPAQPTRNGYTFKGWYIDEAYTTPYDFNTEVNEDKILYAKWEEIQPEEITHNIIYRILGTPNTNNVTDNPTSYKEGTTTPLTIKEPTLEGYTFSGWFENTNLTGNPISSLSVVNRDDDIVLYGEWTKDPEPVRTAQYKVNHYLEDENGTKQYNGKTYKLDQVNSKTLTGTIGDTVTATARSYAGYIKQQDSVEDTVLADGSTTLDLYYNKVNYTIIFDSKGGTKVDNQTKNYEETVDEPENPTKDGYKFLYWYEEKDGKKVIYDFDTPVTSDKKLIAEWEEIKIIPEEPKKEEVPTQKTDTTVAKKVIPNTGIGTAVFGTLLLTICAFFGIRYFKLKKDMK